MGQQTISAAIRGTSFTFTAQTHGSTLALFFGFAQPVSLFPDAGQNFLLLIYQRITRAFSGSATRPHATELLGQVKCPLASSSRFALSEYRQWPRGVLWPARGCPPMRTGPPHDSVMHWERTGESKNRQFRSQYLQFEPARRSFIQLSVYGRDSLREAAIAGETDRDLWRKWEKKRKMSERKLHCSEASYLDKLFRGSYFKFTIFAIQIIKK